ncbi:SDR family NAD(P)-dependent oxidoreductase [Wenxinia marina]|uniref:SDR family NAD(P)-dependent oxidoreductase n=1 Tax=Wenxinia marina TaxID=390641 RepID=UPI0020C7D0C0|nr:SDR family NAD(P)-dependent oxidoreductase [Wenxinia marina]
MAIVTGAGRGIGRAVALAMAGAGAAVVVNDVEAQVAEAVADEIRAAGGRAGTVVAPIGPTEGAEACVAKAIEAFGRLDTMVANAGVLRDSVLWKTEDEAFDLVVQTHLRGAFTCGRAAARHFRAAGQGGRILLVGSPAGQRGNFGQTAYAAAKAGVAAMARTWSMELSRANVTVNAVIPTALTRMVASIPGLQGRRRRVGAGRAGAGPPAQGRPRHARGRRAALRLSRLRRCGRHHRPVHRHRRRPARDLVAPRRGDDAPPARRLERGADPRALGGVRPRPYPIRGAGAAALTPAYQGRAGSRRPREDHE